MGSSETFPPDLTPYQKSRSAGPTIAGYQYQFERSVVEVLELDAGDCLRVEGIEDIDVWRETPNIVQIKYYEGQRWSLSAVRGAVHELLKTFASGLAAEYILYVHFGSGAQPPETLNLDDLKACLTYRPRGKPKQCLYEEFTEEQLIGFIDCFTIRSGVSLDEQRKITTSAIASALRCSDEEAEDLHRMRAVQFLHEIAVKKGEKERTITKSDLLDRIGDREIIYSRWHKEAVGKERFMSAIVKRLRKSQFNVSNTYRGVFLRISSENIESVRGLATELARDMVGTTRKRTTAAKPWTLILRGDRTLIDSVKRSLIQDRLSFNDGYEAIEFSPTLFIEPATVTGVGAADRLFRASYVLRVVSEDSIGQVLETTSYQLAQLLTLDPPEDWQARFTRAKPVHINEVSVDEITEVLRKVVT